MSSMQANYYPPQQQQQQQQQGMMSGQQSGMNTMQNPMMMGGMQNQGMQNQGMQNPQQQQHMMMMNNSNNIVNNNMYQQPQMMNQQHQQQQQQQQQPPQPQSMQSRQPQVQSQPQPSRQRSNNPMRSMSRPPYVDPNTNIIYETDNAEYEGYLTKQSMWLKVGHCDCDRCCYYPEKRESRHQNPKALHRWKSHSFFCIWWFIHLFIYLSVWCISINNQDWRRRFFLLKGSKLFYCSNEYSSPHGMIDLALCTTVKSADLKSRKRNSFEISTPEITYLLYADTEQEKDDWIGRVGKAIVRCSSTYYNAKGSSNQAHNQGSATQARMNPYGAYNQQSAMDSDDDDIYYEDPNNPMPYFND